MQHLAQLRCTTRFLSVGVGGAVTDIRQHHPHVLVSRQGRQHANSPWLIETTRNSEGVRGRVNVRRETLLDEEWHHEVLAEDTFGGLTYTVQADHVHAFYFY